MQKVDRLKITFDSFALAAPIQQAITEEGYTEATPIQAKAIPPVLEGHDVLGVAQTGTGKTAAFALPMIHRLMTAPADKSARGPKLARALILSPTRELTTQIAESFITYGRHAALDVTTIYGGVSQYHQVRALHRGVDVIVATPGRLIDLMQQRVVNLTAIEIFVLDEADRMLDMGFIQPIRLIAAALKAKRQTLLFSATMPSEIKHLADSLLKNPVRVSVATVASTAELVTQSVYMVGRDRKLPLLQHLIRTQSIQRVVVFTKTKHGADKVARRLNNVGLAALAIHGNKAQNLRTRTLDSFKTGRTRVLVATDVAARGLDVDGITHVINFDIPMEPESYIHRIGRTGRAGATGAAISFCDPAERSLLRQVERLLRKPVPPVQMDAALAAKLAVEDKTAGAELEKRGVSVDHANELPDSHDRQRWSDAPQGRRGFGGQSGNRANHPTRPAYQPSSFEARKGGPEPESRSTRSDQNTNDQPRPRNQTDATAERGPARTAGAGTKPVEGWNAARSENRSDQARAGTRTPAEGGRDLANLQPYNAGGAARGKAKTGGPFPQKRESRPFVAAAGAPAAGQKRRNPTSGKPAGAPGSAFPRSAPRAGGPASGPRTGRTGGPAGPSKSKGSGTGGRDGEYW